MTTTSATSANRTPAAKPQAQAAMAVAPRVAKDRVIGGAAALPKDVFVSPSRFNEVTFHVSAEESKQALLAAIEGAKRSFYIETFIWHDDEAGREVVDALGRRKQAAEAKGEPFDVKVLIDYTGLRGSAGGLSDTKILDRFKEWGIEVKEFAKGLIDWKNRKLAPITHRKLYIADGEKFITGGRNIGNEYLNASYALKSGNQEPAWHDMLYTVKGQETGRILDEFFTNWERAGGTRPSSRPLVIPALKGGAQIQTVTTNPHTDAEGIRAAHTKLIAGAKKEIVAMYPYFSDDTLVSQLIAAKKANPKLSVKVILPAAKEESHEGSIYGSLNRESARQLLSAGIEVRMFGGGQVNGEDVQRFSHMKGMVVDGQILSIGSANADARTYHDNHELNTLIADSKTVKDYMAKVVTPNWAQAKPITIAELNQDSFWERLKQKALEVVDLFL
ncbi:MAG: phospholipase D-like domain-containing protein [Candidatus Sericytochromatia bacterium]